MPVMITGLDWPDRPSQAVLVCKRSGNISLVRIPSRRGGRQLEVLQRAVLRRPSFSMACQLVRLSVALALK
jgi:hypothetical protein